MPIWKEHPTHPKKIMSLIGYGCTSAKSLSASVLWEQVNQGSSSAQSLPAKISEQIPQCPSLKAHLWETLEQENQKEKLLRHLMISWQEARDKLPTAARQRIEAGRHLGVILASTKGCIDDFIWKQEESNLDPLTPLLDQFLEDSHLRPAKKICVSNACASGISSLFLAQEWLRDGQLTDVLVLACDAVGMFVLKGFATLKVFASEATQPFSGERNGFFLGEASAALVLSNQEVGDFLIDGIGIDAEGYAVTRPSQSGASLVRACEQLLDLESIDLVVAHGTATQMNDRAEDAAYDKVFSSLNKRPVITASKWAIGHTLGASSAIDLILACECLKRQKIFSIANTLAVDPHLKANYFVSGAQIPIKAFKRVMVSSLGFGGLHAALSVSKAGFLK